MDILKELFKIFKIEINNEEDILNIIIDGDTFKNPKIINNLHSLIPKLKENYKSTALTCLHKNSLDKQKFPAINLIRQILKCNNYKLYGYYISMGYNKQNGKKLLKRVYKITNLDT